MFHLFSIFPQLTDIGLRMGTLVPENTYLLLQPAKIARSRGDAYVSCSDLLA